jgi:hypothetical protein
MSPVAKWSSEWHNPDAETRTSTSPSFYSLSQLPDAIRDQAEGRVVRAVITFPGPNGPHGRPSE